MAVTAKRRAEREHFRDVVDEHLLALTERLLEAAGATKKTYSGVCLRCKSRVEIEHPDIRARTDAIKALHELGYGKPRPDDDGGGTIVLKRRVIAPAETVSQ
jgi:hypothetical protein